MKVRGKVFLFFIFLFLHISSYGVKPRTANAFNNYRDRRNEMSYGVNVSYLRFQDAFSPYLSLNYARYLTDYFAVGVGYSGIYDQYFHNIFSGEISLLFNKKLKFSLKPGITFQKYGDTSIMFSTAIAGSYQFSLAEYVHMGPMLEVTLIQSDINYAAGLRMAFGF